MPTLTRSISLRWVGFLQKCKWAGWCIRRWQEEVPAVTSDGLTVTVVAKAQLTIASLLNDKHSLSNITHNINKSTLFLARYFHISSVFFFFFFAITSYLSREKLAGTQEVMGSSMAVTEINRRTSVKVWHTWRRLPEQDPKYSFGIHLGEDAGDPPQASRTASMLLLVEV